MTAGIDAAISVMRNVHDICRELSTAEKRRFLTSLVKGLSYIAETEAAKQEKRQKGCR